MNQPVKRSLFRNKWVLLGSCAFCLAIALAGRSLWQYYTTHVSTDDAFVESRISSVCPMVTGRVMKILVDDNQEVEKNQILVKLDPKYYQAMFEKSKAAVAVAENQLIAAEEQVSYSRDIISSQVAQAEAALQGSLHATHAARQVMDQAKAILASKEEGLAVAEAELKEKKALEEKAKFDYDRVVSLIEKKAVSQVDFDLAKANYQASAAQVTAAKRKVLQARRELDAASADLKVKKSGYTYSPIHLGMESAKAKEIEVRAKLAETRAKERSIRIKEVERELAKARLEEAIADLKYAKSQLDDTIIRAPMAGRVTKSKVELGQVVRPGQPLMAIVSLSDIWIVANFKEVQLTHVKAGQRVKITVDAYPDERFTGRVDSIQAGTGSRFSLLPPENASGNFVKVVQRIPVKIVLDKHSNPSVLRPGMSVVPRIMLR